MNTRQYLHRVPSLRDMLASPGLTVAPGAYDGIGARLVAQAGFRAVYMTGAGTAMARGFPDFGLLTQTEMADNAGVMARSVPVPVIADADTGYGNELNITRTVREYEARGVAAIHIEDQVAPKRCGHLEGKQVVSRAEFVSKIRAAVEARRSGEFLIIARTDARAMLGLDEAIDRANAALDVGADIAFVEAPQTLDEVERVPRRVRGACLLNIVGGGRTPVFDTAVAESMGYKLAIVPGLLISAAIEAGDAALAALRSTGTVPPVAASVGATFQRFGADDWDALRRRFDAGASAIDTTVPALGTQAGGK
ncbi:oxaloacetate decarboxylase [Pseudorhodoferax sp. Leaf274]|uniref:isocitrate lyase/PEP mutase family protein n=1 Tax=Pseudorhodoferax sp. Leaf274 TaxID=1736318 RepID=UPI000703C1B5|nr:isocitrate lyase/PEP mutase family protein [Pseudorhodoferax sp. Leaf274]KQP49116.1 carboxyvinyl-carboxyphosphonate phosphorylmutase [Pseudorhodoferax sp. Leaf274]